MKPWVVAWCALVAGLAFGAFAWHRQEAVLRLQQERFAAVRSEAELARQEARALFERAEAQDLREAELRSQLALLEAELAESRLRAAREFERRLEREQEFLSFQRGIASVGPAEQFGPGSAFDEALRDMLGLPPPEGSPRALALSQAREQEQQAALQAIQAFEADAERRARSFNALLRIHGVSGLDLLEAGAVRERGWGPVVFRLLDGDGRLAGSLFAEQLELVGSRSGRSLTLRLVAGYETVGGERRPFAELERRIALRHVDPEPFAREFPELFADGALAPPVDDGLWSLPAVRLALNELLREAQGSGFHRVTFLGGVVGAELRDLALDVCDREGRVLRRVVADRGRLSEVPGGVLLELLDGSSLQGDRTAPFLDGRMRIVLPGVSPKRAGERGLPGLSPAPEPKAAEQP